MNALCSIHIMYIDSNTHSFTLGTQTESFMKSMSISTSTLDAPWGPATSMPVKHVHPRPAKRPRVGEEEEEEEEDEGDIFTIKPEPHDSTYDPAQSRSNVTESLQPTYVFWAVNSAKLQRLY